MRFLYNAVFPFVLLVMLPGYLWRMVRRGNYRSDFAQRFGRYAPELRDRFDRGEWLWVHAVSVGELLVALKIIDELHRRNPAWRFVVSSTTSTAHSIALERQKDWWTPVYTPVDLPFIVRRALDAVRPEAVVLVEGEMWPNFVWTCADRGIPVVLANARVSPRSGRRYEKFAGIVRTVTRHLAAVGVQRSEDARIWHLLGVPPEKVLVTGSVKFDPELFPSPPRDFRPVLDAWGIGKTDPVFVAGSTHPGEERLLMESLRILRGKHPKARFLIAPRHTERTAEVLADIGKSGFAFARRTDTPTGQTPDILVIDTTGELRDWYACADAVFVGKSLAGRGGQNPVEAILAGRPVLFGPHMENFAALARDLVSAGGAVMVRNAEELGCEVGNLLGDPERRARMAKRGADALAPHRGATARTAGMVESVAPRKGDSAGSAV